jgi:arylsulfatase A-like enzyme
LERALQYLGSLDWQQPTFLYLHLIDTHEPYREPDLAVVGPLADSFKRVRHDELWRSWDKLANVGKAGHEFELQYMTAAYDSALREVDEAVGGVHRYYRDHGLLEGTLFVVTSDHGEEFLEHGGTGHKGSLFEEILHVPLVVRAPGGLRRTRLSQLVRNFDVAPTLLDYAGIPTPATMDARSLRPALEGRSFDGPTTAYANFPGIRMIRTERYKLLRHEDGTELFFDLATDAGETTSLTRSTNAAVQGAYHSLARDMDRTVEKLRRQGVSKRGPLEAVALDEETRAQLRALGYVE